MARSRAATAVAKSRITAGTEVQQRKRFRTEIEGQQVAGRVPVNHRLESGPAAIVPMHDRTPAAAGADHDDIADEPRADTPRVGDRLWQGRRHNPPPPVTIG